MYQDYLDFAYSVALSAGRLVLQQYRTGQVALKPDGSEVTDADRDAEELMRTMIFRKYPTHEILGEEFGGTTDVNSGHLWVLDPIDGTSWFAMGTPLFGNLVALLENGEPIVGVIHLPALGETVCAAKGQGCWFTSGDSRPERIRVAASVPVDEATITASGAHSSDLIDADESPLVHIRSIMQSALKFKFYGDCVQHVLVCRGHAHAAIDPIMHPWDSAAIIPCVEEAGGVVSTLDGRRDRVTFGGSLLTSCSPLLHEEILMHISTDPSLVPQPAGTRSGHVVPRTTRQSA